MSVLSVFCILKHDNYIALYIGIVQVYRCILLSMYICVPCMYEHWKLGLRKTRCYVKVLSLLLPWPGPVLGRMNSGQLMTRHCDELDLNPRSRRIWTCLIGSEPGLTHPLFSWRGDCVCVVFIYDPMKCVFVFESINVYCKCPFT